MENMRSPLTIANAFDFKDQTEDDIINIFINKPQIRFPSTMSHDQGNI